jgi:hypothetical protein
MKTKITSSKIGALALASVALLHSASLSQAAVIIQDNFNYTDGGLNLNNGGIGWGSNVWFDGNSTVSGGVAVASAGGWDQSHKRNFDATLGASALANNTDVLWVRFDWGHSAAISQNTGYGGLTFYTGTSDGGSENFLIGNPWWNVPGDTEWTISGGSGDQFSGISSNGMKSGLAKFDILAGSVSLWVRATGSTIDVTELADASVTGLSLGGIRGIRINGYNGTASQSFDNLTIATTLADVNAIPEPSAALLGGLSALAMLRRRRR